MDNNVKSYRKPYVQPVKANWWTDRAFYIAYMLREGTAVVALWVALELIYFALLAVLTPQSLEAIEDVAAFIKSPIVIILNIIALVSVLYHALTWYNLMPKAVRMFLTNNPTDTKLLPEVVVTGGLWIGTVCASIVIILALCLA